MIDVAVIQKVSWVTDRTVAAAIIAGRAAYRHNAGSAISRLQRTVGVVAGSTRIMDLIIGGAQRYTGCGACSCGMARRALAVRRHK